MWWKKLLCFLLGHVFREVVGPELGPRLAELVCKRCGCKYTATRSGAG